MKYYPNKLGYRFSIVPFPEEMIIYGYPFLEEI